MLDKEALSVNNHQFRKVQQRKEGEKRIGGWSAECGRRGKLPREEGEGREPG